MIKIWYGFLVLVGVVIVMGIFRWPSASFWETPIGSNGVPAYYVCANQSQQWTCKPLYITPVTVKRGH